MAQVDRYVSPDEPRKICPFSSGRYKTEWERQKVEGRAREAFERRNRGGQPRAQRAEAALA